MESLGCPSAQVPADDLSGCATLLDALPLPVVVADPDGRLRYANPAFAALRRGPGRGFDPGEGLGAVWADPAEADAALARLRSERSVQAGPMAGRRLDGSTFTARFTLREAREGVPGILCTFQDLSGQADAEAALKESEARFDTAFRFMPVALGITDLRTREFLAVNRAFGEIYGWTAEELQGRSAGEIGIWADPKDREEVVGRLLAGRPVRDFETRIRRKDGALRWVSYSGERVPVGGRDCLLSSAVDITARKEAEAARLSSQDMLAEFVRHSPIHAYIKEVTPGQSRVVIASDNFQDLIGIPGREMTGMTMAELFPPEFAAKITADDWAVASSGEVLRLEEELGGRSYTTIKFPIQNGQRTLLAGYTIEVTDRTRMEQELREKEYFFRESQRAASIGSYKNDFQTGFWESSEVLDRIFGIGPDYVRDLPGWLGVVHPEDRERMGRYLAEVVIGGRQPFHQEYRIRRIADGETRWVLGLGRATFDADGRIHTMIGTIQDVTERKQAEEALLRSESYLRGIWDAEPECVKLVSAEGMLLDMNPAGLAMLEVEDPAQAIGKPIIGMVVEADRPRFLEIARRAFSEGAATGAFEIVGRKGTHRWMETHAVPLRDAGGGPPVLLAVTRDITARRRAEQDRLELEQQVARAQKLESLGSLAGGVAHDMNNVLGAILSIASLYQSREESDPALRRNMDTVVNACLRGRTLVQGLLGFARQGVAEERLLDLNQLVRDEVALLARTTLQRVDLCAELDPGLASVRGDPAALGHALMNLCINAVDAMPDGGTLTLRTRNQEGERVLLEVADSGHGMPREVLDKALDPFFTTKPQGQGTGLGLSIVYGTVKAHGGQLEIRSAPGAGTTVSIQLPAAALPTREELRESAIAPAARGLQVLLVDDDELIQQSTAPILEAIGHQPTIVDRGEEALARLAAGLPCDVVILDMNMPGMGGAATLPRIRSLRPGLPVLLATGRADQQAMQLAASVPGTTLLPKPFTLAELRRHLGALG